MSLLRYENLSISFGAGRREKFAVNQLNLDIGIGERLALVGESGSGKSISALSLMRLLPPSAKYSGEAYFSQENLLKIDEESLRKIRGSRITMVFQEPMTSLNPLHTIEQQISEILELHGLNQESERRARVVELLTEVGIPNPSARLGAYPHQLSGGQRQRVMIAMAVANKPDLLIADEPTTALDVTVQAQILSLLDKLKTKMNMGMLLITHDFGVVADVADHVVVMFRGEIVESGTVSQVLKKPKHPYTKALLDCVPDAEGKKALKPIDYAWLTPKAVKAKNVKAKS